MNIGRISGGNLCRLRNCLNIMVDDMKKMIINVKNESANVGKVVDSIENNIVMLHTDGKEIL